MGQSPQRPSLADRTYRELRNAVVAGRLRPGTALVEADVAQMLNVSRTPVREALRRCELEGSLQRDAHGRLRVKLPTPDEVEKLFFVRELIECHAARLAAERISDAELERFDRLVEEDADALGRPGGAERRAELNNEIHQLLIEASRNRTLGEIMLSFTERFHGLRAFVFGDVADQKRFVEEHAQLAVLLRTGDADALDLLMRAHLARAKELLIGGLRGS